jgi:hypothetical protein
MLNPQCPRYQAGKSSQNRDKQAAEQVIRINIHLIIGERL